MKKKKKEKKKTEASPPETAPKNDLQRNVQRNRNEIEAKKKNRF